LLGDFTILEKTTEKSLAGMKRGQTKAKIATGKENERSIKYSIRQPTTRDGSTEIPQV